MLQKQTVNQALRAITFGLLSCVLLPNLAQARGAFPEVINGGQCTKTDGSFDPNISTRAVLRKSQGIWYFSMETDGVNSEGVWSIRVAKNGPLGKAYTTTIDPPGGWAVIGGQTTSLDKGIVTFAAEATKTASRQVPVPVSSSGVGDVCNVTISYKI
jgi:hypothetical protein